jgi:hypothetical protein
MRQFFIAAILAVFALPSAAMERWETLPPTPAPIPTDRVGEAEANGIKIHYAVYGQGSPVIFLHGGPRQRRLLGQLGPRRGGASHGHSDG